MTRRIIAVGSVLLIMLQIIMPTVSAEESVDNGIASVTDSSIDTLGNRTYDSTLTYRQYTDKNGGIVYGDGNVIIITNDEIVLNESSVENKVSFNVDKKGWYAIKFDYLSLGEGSNNHKIALSLDNTYQFLDMKSIEIPRIWQAGKISILKDGTQVRGDAVADSDWASYTMYDLTGMVTDPFMIFLTEGNHTLNIKWIDGNLKIRKLTLFAFKGLENYEAYIASHTKKYDGEPLETIEGENFVKSNSLSITANSDLSSPFTTPYSYTDQLLNVMGGSNWQYIGQRVEWTVTAPEDGLYNLAIRFKQSYKNNMKAYRKLLINGEVPFLEATALPFDYSGGWQCFKPDWAIWLNKGENTLALEVSPGEAAELMNGVKDAVQRLNVIYRRILMLTGTRPDSYRDYHLDVEIPGIAEEFKKIAKQLGELLNIVEKTYSSATSFSVLQDTKRQLEDMAKNLRSVTKSGRLDRFKSNISSLASLAQSLREQPLQIDSIVLYSPNKTFEVEKESFWQSTVHKWKRFIVSFGEEYNVSISSSGKNSLTVWTSLGRDQLGILKSMVANEFEPKHQINTEVQLVTGSLIQAVLAGKAPDIVLGLGETDVINYAMRGALVNLAEFSDHQEIMTRFSTNAADPFTYQEGVYAIPQTQNFQMMFVRDDILAELGLNTPKTWTDFITEIFPVLQRENLLVGVGNLNNGGALSGIFLTLLYQYGGKLYSDDLLSSALTTPQALEAFDFAVSLYKEYGVPTQYDFLNRFRTGEMPIAIADYGTYNSLQVGAPEISGLWTMVPIPGVMQPDGSINNTQLMGFSGSIILADTDVKEEAWKFLKWWSSSDVQRSFGMQQEAILGPSGRYTTANLEALANLSWGGKQLALLENQRNVSSALMHVPGSYYIGKSINSALVTSVNDSTLIAREQLMHWVNLIDREMTRKQKEFNFKGRKLTGGRES